MDDFKIMLKKKAKIINETLEGLMNINDKIISNTLLKAMKYTLFSGGKRIRPILTIMIAELLDGDVKSARKLGAAIELIHTYSLIHDDLPSMDNDNYRRGKLTNHKVFGTGIAILAGDGLLTYGFNILTHLDLPPENRIKIIELISNGIGYNGMVGGQVLDLEAENKDISIEELKIIHKAKTGALFNSSILAGVYCSNFNNEEFNSLREFADYLGILFQIVDDILDVSGSERKLGKKVGRDKDLNKATYPLLLGLEKAKEEANKTAELAKNSLYVFGDRADELLKLVDYVLNRQS